MISDNVHGLFAVFPVKLDCAVGRYTVWGKKCDHIPCSTIGKIRIDDLLQLVFADSFYGEQFFRFLIQDLQSLLAESVIDPLGCLFADSSNLAGSQICDDSFAGRHDHFLITLHIELDAMFLTFAPFAFQSVFDFIGGRQTVANSLETVKNVTGCISQSTAWLIDCDHKAGTTCSRIPRKYDFFKFT